MSELKETTTQKVEERKYQEMFSQMKDWGKKSVYDLNRRFSTDYILELLEGKDIYPVNFVDGWKENYKDWNQDEYDRMKKELFKGFMEGLNELKKMKPQRGSRPQRITNTHYWWDEFGSPWGPGKSYKPWIK